jgi:hypothetical protein
MFRWLASIFAFCTLLCGSATAGPPIARFQSALGNFDVLLNLSTAPLAARSTAWSPSDPRRPTHTRNCRVNHTDRSKSESA